MSVPALAPDDDDDQVYAWGHRISVKIYCALDVADVATGAPSSPCNVTSMSIELNTTKYKADRLRIFFQDHALF